MQSLHSKSNMMNGQLKNKASSETYPRGKLVTQREIPLLICTISHDVK